MGFKYEFDLFNLTVRYQPRFKLEVLKRIDAGQLVVVGEVHLMNLRIPKK